MKKKLVLLQIFIAIIFISTSVYAAISATLDLKVSKTTLYPGDTVRVTLSVKDISGTTTGITNISGYINYDKDVFEAISKDNIVKESSGKVKVGNAEIPLYDLVSGSSDECMLFNDKPASNNDVRLLIDLNNNNAIKGEGHLISLDFKVKQSASFKTVENAVRFTGFVLTADGQNLSELSKTITITINNPNPPVNNNTNNNNTNNNNNNTNNTNNNNNNTNQSGNNNLQGIFVDGNAVSGFSKNTLVYTLPSVENSKSSITINAIAEDSKATVTGTGAKNLSVGNNSFNILVTAENGSQKSYVVNIERNAASGNNNNANENNSTNNNNTNNNNNNTNNTNNNNNNTNNTNNNNANNNSNNTNLNSNNPNGNANTDNTLKTGNLPATGFKTVMVPIILCMSLAFISYNKYMRYRGV